MNKLTAVAVLVLGLLSTNGQAAFITYSDFVHAGSDVVDYSVTIDDSTAGKFVITYAVSNLSPNSVGKLTGLFFDFGTIDTISLPDPDTSDPYANLSDLGLSGESNPSNTLICGTAFGDINSVSGAGGCNSALQLSTTIIDGHDYAGFEFDVGVAWKVNDLSANNSEGVFSIDTNGFSLDDWGVIGLRGQDTSGLGGSAKEFMLMGVKQPVPPPEPTPSIPEPSTLMILGIGLMGLSIRKIVV
jgi:hypothetical protein